MKEEAVDIWLEDAKTRAIAGTRAEKSCIMIEELLVFIKEVGGCSKCYGCCNKAEEVLDRMNAIAEEI